MESEKRKMTRDTYRMFQKEGMNMKLIKVCMMFGVCIVLMACASDQQDHNSIGELGIKETKAKESSKLKKVKNNGKDKNYEEGKNPIDESKYFRPLFETSYKGTENSRRELMTRYYFAWKEEYENIIKWLSDKCKYEEDKKDILRYNLSVVESIEENSDSVLKTMILDSYEDEPEERIKGLSTDSRIRYEQGKMYRGICLSLLESVSDDAVSYTFLKKNYSQISIG